MSCKENDNNKLKENKPRFERKIIDNPQCYKYVLKCLDPFNQNKIYYDHIFDELYKKVSKFI